jgi:hypothetical protein
MLIRGSIDMNEVQLVVKNRLKHKIVFAFLMGIITTGLVSLTVILANLGFTETFWLIWLKSWSMAFLVAVPVILIVSPIIERFVGFLFKERAAFMKGKRRKIYENTL